MTRAVATLAALAFCCLAVGHQAAETSDHERLSVRRPEAVAVSLDLDLELSAPLAGLLEGGLSFGLGLDVGGCLEVGLSLPLLFCIDLGGTPRRVSRFTLAPGRGDLRLGLGFSAGAWRFSGDADLGCRPAVEGGPATLDIGAGCGALRFLDPLALGLDFSVSTGLGCGDASDTVRPPLSLSLGFLVLEALNGEASFVFQFAQSLVSSGGGGRAAEGWVYSLSLGLRIVISRDPWGLRIGFTGLECPSFQSGLSWVWRPTPVPPP